MLPCGGRAPFWALEVVGGGGARRSGQWASWDRLVAPGRDSMRRYLNEPRRVNINNPPRSSSNA